MIEDMRPPGITERGAVRLSGGPLAHSVRVEVWDGAQWLPLRGVTSASLVVDTKALHLRLQLSHASLEIMAAKGDTSAAIVLERDGNGEG